MQKRSSRRVRYTGELATPIRLRDHENVDAAIGVIQKRLEKLASMFKVDLNAPDGGLLLALALAHEHVPGLRLPMPRKPRREATWLAGLGEFLRWEVDAARGSFNGKIVKAIDHLRANKSKVWRKHKPKTLATRYREASRRYKSASQRERITLAVMANDAKRRFKAL